jgi:hypothetical protein
MMSRKRFGLSRNRIRSAEKDEILFGKERGERKQEKGREREREKWKLNA